MEHFERINLEGDWYEQFQAYQEKLDTEDALNGVCLYKGDPSVGAEDSIEYEGHDALSEIEIRMPVFPLQNPADYEADEIENLNDLLRYIVQDVWGEETLLHEETGQELFLTSAVRVIHDFGTEWNRPAFSVIMLSPEWQMSE